MSKPPTTTDFAKPCCCINLENTAQVLPHIPSDRIMVSLTGNALCVGGVHEVYDDY